MILYYAAAESGLKELSEINASNLLITMANGMKKIPLVPKHFDNYNLIIDSGAFTYHKTGGIYLSKWLREASKVRRYGTEIIGLDVIGDAQKSYENYIEIIKKFNCIPTFHVGSDISYLKKYLEHTDRIAIGGMVGYKSEITYLQTKLNEIFSLFNSRTLPRFHAFGYFSQQILENYPFYSADASTWQNYSRFGEFHKFENFKYKRIKSLRVEKVNITEATIEDLTTLRMDVSLMKLKRIKEALDSYELYLTELWTKRGISWK